MSIEEEARTEAYRRFTGDTIVDETTGETVPFDDYGYAETEHKGFIAGAVWAASRPASPATRETADLDDARKWAMRHAMFPPQSVLQSATAWGSMCALLGLKRPGADAVTTSGTETVTEEMVERAARVIQGKPAWCTAELASALARAALEAALTEKGDDRD